MKMTLRQNINKCWISVDKVFREKNIDPRANLQFDEFNDIEGITEGLQYAKRKRASDNQKPGAPMGKKSVCVGFVFSPM